MFQSRLPLSGILPFCASPSSPSDLARTQRFFDTKLGPDPGDRSLDDCASRRDAPNSVQFSKRDLPSFLLGSNRNSLYSNEVVIRHLPELALHWEVSIITTDLPRRNPMRESKIVSWDLFKFFAVASYGLLSEAWCTDPTRPGQHPTTEARGTHPCNFDRPPLAID